MKNLEERRQEIEEITEILLKDNYMFKEPINPMTLTRNYDFKVYLVSFNKSNISGALLIKDGVVSFYMNNNVRQEQKKYILSHLLGRYFLHYKDEKMVNLLVSNIDLHRGLNKDDFNQYSKETEANMFADAFLVPSELVERAINLYGGFQLGKRFEVSDDMIKRRLSQIETD